MADVACIVPGYNPGGFTGVSVGEIAESGGWPRSAADRAINDRCDDFVNETLSFTNGRGADAVLDRGAALMGNFRAMASDGRYAVISLQAGREVTADFNAF